MSYIRTESVTVQFPSGEEFSVSYSARDSDAPEMIELKINGDLITGTRQFMGVLGRYLNT